MCVCQSAKVPDKPHQIQHDVINIYLLNTDCFSCVNMTTCYSAATVAHHHNTRGRHREDVFTDERYVKYGSKCVSILKVKLLKKAVLAK